MNWHDIPQRMQQLSDNVLKHEKIMKRFLILEEPRLAMLPSTPQMLDWRDEDEDEY